MSYRDETSNLHSGRGCGVFLSALVAGPLTMLVMVLPDALSDHAGSTVSALGFLTVAALIVGFFPALVLSLAGTTLLRSLSRKRPWASAAPSWVAAGAAMATPFALFFPSLYFTPTIAFALAGAACGLICWTIERPSPPA